MYVSIDIVNFDHVIYKNEHIKNLVTNIFRNRIFMKTYLTWLLCMLIVKYEKSRVHRNWINIDQCYAMLCIDQLSANLRKTVTKFFFWQRLKILINLLTIWFDRFLTKTSIEIKLINSIIFWQRHRFNWQSSYETNNLSALQFNSKYSLTFRLRYFISQIACPFYSLITNISVNSLTVL